jgi:hypothetical protein
LLAAATVGGKYEAENGFSLALLPLAVPTTIPAEIAILLAVSATIGQPEAIPR